MDGTTRLRVGLLGTFTAYWDGDPLDLGGPRQRAVLALLLLARGEVVPGDRLAEFLWGDAGPADTAGALLDDFPAEAAERLFAVAGPGSGSPQVMVEIRQLGGAYSREARYPNAFSHRSARYSVLTVGIAPDDAVVAHAQRLFAALADWDTGGVWPNFGRVHDVRSARRAYDPETRARLAEVVRRYDPQGVLQLGRWTRASAD